MSKRVSGPMISSSPASTGAATPCAVSLSSGSPESPKPGMSGTSTSRERASGPTLRIQCVQEP